MDDKTSYFADGGLSDGHTYTITVQETDAAGNWSPAAGFTTEVDFSATVPPQITIGDGLPVLRTVKTMTWNVLSGTGGNSTRYRYYFDGSGSWTVENSVLSTVTPVSIPHLNTGSLTEGSHSITIQEGYIVGDTWLTDKEATHTIIVDTIAPVKPVLTGTGLATGDTDRTATPNVKPSWNWSSGGGGNGKFKFRFTRTNHANGSADGTVEVDFTDTLNTTVTSYTPSALSEGTYLLEVQERDDAGNWSAVASLKTTVDTTYPTLTSVLIRGSSHPSDSDYTYTNTTSVSVDLVGNISTELNSSYSRPVRINMYDYNPAAWEDYTYPWAESNTTAETITTVLPSGDGTKYVYIRLIDEAGNTTAYKYDTIIQDTTAPTGTFSINNGAATTPSLSFYLTLSATDNYSGASDIEVMTYNPYGSGWGTYRTYTTSMLSDFQWPVPTSSSTSRYTYVAFRDAAGNVTGALYDNIIQEVPVMTYATKGSSSTSITVNWNPVSATEGTTYYYLYSATSPGVNPNTTPSSVTSEGLATSGSAITESLAAAEKEQLRYYFVRTYNATTGGWGPYSLTSVLGFGSNITIIYDSTDSTDTTLATYIKSVLQSDLPTSVPSSVSGTMPGWTVTLLPEDLVSATYSTANIIYGDPVILTTSAADIYASAGKVRNIVAGGRGIIPMGYAGLQFLKVASDNWTAWGYPATASTDADQQPNEIGYGNSYTYTAGKYYMFTWRSGNTVWTSPLSSTSIPTSTNEDQVQIGYSTAAAAERALYRPARDNPVRGYLYGRSQDYTDRFPVVRQGRFLYYGYDQMWTRSYTGWVYFINLVARMDDY